MFLVSDNIVTETDPPDQGESDGGSTALEAHGQEAAKGQPRLSARAVQTQVEARKP
jgi:hypothetical protein